MVVYNQKQYMSINNIGRCNTNPLIDTSVYGVELSNGEGQYITENRVSESIFQQCDPYGNGFLLFNHILDNKSTEDVIYKDEGFIRRKHHNPERCKNTIGWELLVKWDNSPTRWGRLSDINESYLNDTTNYANGNIITYEPAFDWWAMYVLKKRKIILSKLKEKYW